MRDSVASRLLLLIDEVKTAGGRLSTRGEIRRGGTKCHEVGRCSVAEYRDTSNDESEVLEAAKICPLNGRALKWPNCRAFCWRAPT
jgi:hypothetical protein